MAGYGEQSWGGSPWGGGEPGPFDVLRIFARTAQHIRIELSSAPRAIGDRSALDALTRSNYTLTATNRSIREQPPIPRILQVHVVTDQELELQLAGEMEGPATTYTLMIATTVQNTDGALIGVRAGKFKGVTIPRTNQGGRRLAGTLASPDLVDFKYSHTPSSPAGSLKVTAEGDYDLSDGEETLRKLIYRRLTTHKGEFTHIPGYGFRYRQSGPMGGLRLEQLQEDIRRQLLREPELADVQIALQHRVGTGILIVTVRATMRDSRSTSTFQAPVQIGGGP